MFQKIKQFFTLLDNEDYALDADRAVKSKPVALLVKAERNPNLTDEKRTNIHRNVLFAITGQRYD